MAGSGTGEKSEIADARAMTETNASRSFRIGNLLRDLSILRQVGTVQHESEAKPIAITGSQEICEPSLCRIAQRAVALRNNPGTAATRAGVKGVNPPQSGGLDYRGPPPALLISVFFLRRS